MSALRRTLSSLASLALVAGATCALAPTVASAVVIADEEITVPDDDLDDGRQQRAWGREHDDHDRTRGGRGGAGRAARGCHL